MRTTLSINDGLLRRAKAVALRRNCTLGEVIEDALRVALAAGPKSVAPPDPRPLKIYRGTGVQPGVDLCSSNALLDLMDGR